MNRALIPLILFFGIFISGCTEGLLSASFDTTFTESFTVAAGTISDTTVSGTTDPLMLNQDELSNNGASLDQVTSAKIKTCTITITNPTSEDFSFLQSFSLSMQGEGLDQALVASGTVTDGSVNTISLDLEDVDVVQHLKANSFTLTGSSTTTEAVSEDLTFEVNMVVAVTADVL